jgi:5'-methylthioadenosine phosphorylase
MSLALGVIGGSGLYDMPGLEEPETIEVDTPYGAPSDALRRARVSGSDNHLLFLPRHGRGHRVPPHAINYRANLCAMKKLGADAVLSISAVGSMRDDVHPGDLVVVDQFIDLTKRRRSTYFDEGVAAHVAFANPVCPVLAGALFEVASAVAGKADTPPSVHRGGTYVCIEGPQFSTRAESLVYRSWNVDVVGMTNMPEAKLAREAELPYATLALATDYDCWHESEEAVDVASVIKRLQTMVGHAQQIVLELARALPTLDESPARGALDGAIMTKPDAVPAALRADLAWLLPTLGR